MFSTATSSRLRFQLSSSVSIDTTTIVSRVSAMDYPRRPIEGAHPPPPPSRPEDDDLTGLPLRPGPVRLVAVLAAQEVEPAVAALDRAADHAPHQHEADTLPFPF